MKANRHARESRGTGPFRGDERGASEIVGYMIAFGMSSLILVLSLTAFNLMRDYSGDLVADRTVKEIAQRVAFGVDEALQAGAQFPESEFSRTIRLPAEVEGRRYTVELGRGNVWVNVTDAQPPVRDADGNDLDILGRANATLIPRANAAVLCTGGWMALEGGSCRADSSDGEVVVRYGKPHDAATDRGVFLVRT